MPDARVPGPSQQRDDDGLTDATTGALPASTVVADGLAAGLLGAVVVAAIHFVADVSAGEAFRTPTLLGVLFAEGPEAAKSATPGFGTALQFTSVHIALWLGLGCVGSWLVSVVEARPRFAGIAFAGFTFVFASLLYVAGAFSLPGLPPLHLWLGTVLGAAAAAVYLAWRHPRLAGNIKRERLTDATRAKLEEALSHETADQAAYRALADRFTNSSFTHLAEEKRARAALLRSFVDARGLQGAEADAAAPDLAETTLDGALHRALATERDTIARYDRFLASVPELRVRELFLRLRYQVADTTIPEIERAIETETPER